jgi:ATP-binding protein involved in chromosome partitioning
MPSEGTDAREAPRPGTPLPGVRHIIAVASGKGGVGKSTVAVNLACALGRMGGAVGLLDADIYGPSAPLMLGSSAAPQPGAESKIRPVEQHGVRVISMGFFLNDKTPVIWRGPLAMSATKQFLRGVEWGQLEWLVVDLPPGTGDIALTLAQEVPLSGGVVVTTPQDVALADVRRGVAMLEQVRTPVIGIVENMSGYVCGACGAHEDIFGDRSREDLEQILGAPVLAEVPLVEDVCRLGDAGTPIVIAKPDHPVSQIFADLAVRVQEALRGARDAGEPEPTAIGRSADGSSLRVAWSDGHESEYPLGYLRGWCPCAECQGHEGRRRFVHAPDVALVSWEPVGRYALCFEWEGGHRTGIYSYAYLRALCACARCKPGGADAGRTRSSPVA